MSSNKSILGSQLLKDIDSICGKMTENKEIPENFKKEALEELASIRKTLKKEQEATNRLVKGLVRSLSREKTLEDLQDDVAFYGTSEIEDHVNGIIKDMVPAIAFFKWNDLPAELKMECINKTDFSTSLNLRRTARAERQLVDSRKYDINHLILNADDLTITIDGDEHGFCYTLDSDREEAVAPLMAYIMKRASIKKLEVIEVSASKDEEVINALQELCPFGITELNFCNENQKLLKFFLKNAGDTKFEDIDISPAIKSDMNKTMEELMKLPTIINTKLLSVVEWTDSLAVANLIEEWIKQDVPIGQKLQVYSARRGKFGNFAANLQNRVVSSTNDIIRIRTDNESKHILIKVMKIQVNDDAIFCEVINSNRPNIAVEISKWFKEMGRIYYESDDEPDDFDFDDSDDDDFDDSDDDDDHEDYGVYPIPFLW